MAKAPKTPEEKATADQKRKDNLAAANKKKAEERAAAKKADDVAIKDLEKPETFLEKSTREADDQFDKDEASSVLAGERVEIPAASDEFNAILADIKAGKEVTIESEKGVYFKFEDNRLKKYSKQGGHMDSYPLYAFQSRTGWALKK